MKFYHNIFFLQILKFFRIFRFPPDEMKEKYCWFFLGAYDECIILLKNYKNKQNISKQNNSKQNKSKLNKRKNKRKIKRRNKRKNNSKVVNPTSKSLAIQHALRP